MTENELYHHGILGMKWGIRRYQNEDGSLTSAGKSRYGVGDRIGRKAMASAQRHAKTVANRRDQREEEERMHEKASSIRRAGGIAGSIKRTRSNMRTFNNQVMYSPVNGKAITKAAKSKNPILKRRINESYENRLERGRILRGQGRTKAGAVGRAYCRSILYATGAGLGLGLVSAIAPPTTPAVMLVSKYAGTAILASSAVRAYQDIADMTTYDDHVTLKDKRK